MHNSFDWNVIHVLPFSERQRKIIASVENKARPLGSNLDAPLVSFGSGVAVINHHEPQFLVWKMGMMRGCGSLDWHAKTKR